MAINLSIKGVDEAVAVRLRLRAARNHRSLQGELMAIIERAAEEGAESEPGTVRAGDSSQRLGASDERVVVRQGSKTIEQIAAEHRQHFPKPISKLPRSVDLIREMRDSR